MIRANACLLCVAAICASVVSVVAAQTTATSSADTLVADAVRQAAREHKGVILVFGASWCMPCRELEAFLNSPDASQGIGRYYLLRHLTVFEREDKSALNTPGAESLFNKLAGDGIPLIAFLDAAGEKVGIWNDGLPNEASRGKFLALFADRAPSLAADARPGLLVALKHGLGVYTVSGRVLDDHGQPLVNASVSVVSSTYNAQGQRTPIWGPRGKSDETGRYSIEGATPGDCQIVADADNAAGVVSITLRAHEDRDGIDLRLAGLRTVLVKGTAVRSNGQPIAHEVVTLTNLDRPAVFYKSMSGADGRFVFSNVRTGRYNAVTTLASSPSATTLLEAAVQPLLVLNSAGGELRLLAKKAGSLSGTVTFTGGQVTPTERAGIRIVAAAVEPEPGAPSRDVKSTVSSDGRFTFPGLFGPRVLRVTGLPAGWTLASARLNGTDIAHWPTDFGGLPAIDGATILIARDRR